MLKIYMYVNYCSTDLNLSDFLLPYIVGWEEQKMMLKLSYLTHSLKASTGKIS